MRPSSSRRATSKARSRSCGVAAVSVANLILVLTFAVADHASGGLPSAKVLGDVRQTLKDVAGENVAVEVKIDPAIIGGIVVKLGSRMVDASLRTKLNGIRTAMKEVG